MHRKAALQYLRSLPRVGLNNLTSFPFARRNQRNRRGQHGGRKRGFGHRGLDARMSPAPIGFEPGEWTPLVLRVPKYPYYRDESSRRQYPPLSLHRIQYLIDMGRLDASRPLDLGVLCASGAIRISDNAGHWGVQLIDDGWDNLQIPIWLEVQWTVSDKVIAAVERAGGILTQAFYDLASVSCLKNPSKFFSQSKPIPTRLLPPKDLITRYTDPYQRGYLADTKEVEVARKELAKKYNYSYKCKLPPHLATFTKPIRLVFNGLQPGWIVSMKDKAILKPRTQKILDLYQSQN